MESLPTERNIHHTTENDTDVGLSHYDTIEELVPVYDEIAAEHEQYEVLEALTLSAEYDS